MNKMKTMTVSDFESFLDRCGSVRSDWLANEREAVDRLLAQSTDAQFVLHRAEALERMLDVVSAPTPSDALIARVAAIPKENPAYWVWTIVARPVWRPAILAAAMLGGVYLGVAGLPASTALGDNAFDLNSIAGGDEVLNMIESLEE